MAIAIRSCPKNGSPSNTSVGTPQWPALSSLVGGNLCIEVFRVGDHLGIEFGEVEARFGRGVREMLAFVPVLRPAPDQLSRLVRER